jgi:hypothetical protein
MACYISVQLLAGSVSADAISVSQSLDAFEIPFEDTVGFEITLTWTGPQSKYYFGRPLEGSFERLKVGRFSSSISSSGFGPDEVTTKQFKYELIPTAPGKAIIRSIAIGYLQWPDSIPGELVTEEMSVRVAEPLPVEKEKNQSSVWWFAGAAILVAAGGGVTVWIMRRRRPVEKERSPEEIFLDKLSDLKKEAGADLKKFQSGLYLSLSDFLMKRYSLAVRSLHEEKLEEALVEGGLSKGRAVRIAGWLSRAQKDKFAPVEAAPGETVRLEAEIRSFFEVKQRS